MNGYWTPKGFKEISTTTLTPEVLTGTYVAWLISETSANAIRGWCKLVGIPNPVDTDYMHTTVMYSPELAVDPAEHGDHLLKQPYLASCRERRSMEVLGAPGSTGSLVVKFNSPTLMARHLYWRDTRGLEHSFPEYIAHVTLAKDAGEVPPDVMKRVYANPLQLPIVYDRERVSWVNK